MLNSDLCSFRLRSLHSLQSLPVYTLLISCQSSLSQSNLTIFKQTTPKTIKMRYSIAATALMAGAVTAVPALQAGGYGGYGASQITDGQVQVPTSAPAYGYGPETTPAPYVPSTTEESPEVTKYSTQHVTIISCHSTVKNCPASSTVVSTSLVPVVPTYPATTPETTPVYVPSTPEVSTPVVVPTTPVYVPTTPVVVPTTPVVVPTTPVYVPTTPVVPGTSEAPTSPATYAPIIY